MKYHYWHRILRINPDRDDLKSQVQEGKLVSFSRKREGRIQTFNMKTGTESWLFDVDYVGRIPVNMPIPEKVSWLEQHEIHSTPNDEEEKP